MHTMARGTAAKQLARAIRLAAREAREFASKPPTPPFTRNLQPLKPGPLIVGSEQKRGVVFPVPEEIGPEPITGPKVERILTDLYGAVSVANQVAEQRQTPLFRNVDGERIEDGRYKEFLDRISSFVPKSRQFTDPVRTFAYGTDASFYRLNPKAVIKVENEAEVAKILPIAKELGVPVTFRAAGTSLSGQAITDSVLLKLSHTGKNFRNYEIHVRPYPSVFIAEI
jgi:hypothetical protein